MNENLELLLGNLSGNTVEKEASIKYFKKHFPHLMYDRVAIEFDDKGNIANKDTASAIWGWQRDVIYNLKPAETPIVISHLTNGSGKTFTITLSLTLLLIDDHPSLSEGFKDIQGEFWLLTNPSLLKTEYPKAFLQYPGFLGKEEVYKKQGFYEITDSKGNIHTIKLIKNTSGEIEGFKNETNGKSIRFWSYSVNEQKLAGHNPLSIFCDEFGDKTTTSSASGANKLTYGKFEEMIVRCGRNHLVGNNWVFCLFFTLTLGETWMEDLIDLAKDKKAIIPDLNKRLGYPEDHQAVHLVKGTRSSDNPFLNKQTLDVAIGLSDLLGMKDSMARRLISTDNDDPSLVFPKSCRPKRMELQEVQDILAASKVEPGWMFVESVDPGWNDHCSVLFSLVHPVKGIYILHEFYEAGKTVPQVANIVHHIEKGYFGSRKVDIRMYDPNHFKKTTQETIKPNYHFWKEAGLPGIASRWSRGDRSYDRMMMLLLNGLVHYYPVNCKGLDREIRKHKKDQYGIPEEKSNNHSIDNMRYISNWFYDDYAKKIHLAEPESVIEMSEGQKLYKAQVAYYHELMKQHHDKKHGPNKKVMGYSITPLSLKNIKGF